MIQKATELGVTKLIPILTERTIVRKINLARINKIVIEAAEQSNRLDIPKIEKLTKFKNFLKENKNTNIVFGDLNTNNVKFDFKDERPVCVLIGPEGDFTEDERNEIFNQKKLRIYIGKHLITYDGRRNNGYSEKKSFKISKY